MKKLFAILLLVFSITACSSKKASTGSTNDSASSSDPNATADAGSNIRNAYTVANSLYSDTQDWGQVTVSALSAAESDLKYQQATSSAANEVSVYSSTAGGIVLAVKDISTGKCLDMKQTPSSSVMYGTGSCDASSVGAVAFAQDADSAGWS